MNNNDQTNHLRVITYNVNGIRSAINKGFIEWLKTDPADVICIQETKAAKENIDHKVLNDLVITITGTRRKKKGTAV